MNLNIKQILSTNFNLTLEEILNIFYNKFVIIKATVTYKGHSTLKCLFLVWQSNNFINREIYWSS